MLRLPRTLSQELRAELAPCIKAQTTSAFLRELTRLVLGLFQAQDGIGVLEFPEAEKESAKPIAQAATRRANMPEDYPGKLCFHWIHHGIHAEALKVLEERLSPISYSSFSWPFPSSSGEENGSFSFPREYSLFIPFSSGLLVQTDSDTEFAGYIAVLFDEFPTLSEEQVQLIVVLSQLTSNLFEAFLRRQPAQPLQTPSKTRGW